MTACVRLRTHSRDELRWRLELKPSFPPGSAIWSPAIGQHQL